MIPLALAVSLAAAPCLAADAKAALLSRHENAPQAHLRGDADLLAAGLGDQLLLAEKGTIRMQSKAEVAQFYKAYLQRVRYSQWRDVSPPAVTISPDGNMAWMAVAVEARYTRTDRPAEGEKRFTSSWIATYSRDGCDWRMTGIASDVVE